MEYILVRNVGYKSRNTKLVQLGTHYCFCSFPTDQLGTNKKSKTHKQLFNWSGLDRSQDVAEGRLFCVCSSFKPISIVLNPVN